VIPTQLLSRNKAHPPGRKKEEKTFAVSGSEGKVWKVEIRATAFLAQEIISACRAKGEGKRSELLRERKPANGAKSTVRVPAHVAETKKYCSFSVSWPGRS